MKKVGIVGYRGMVGSTLLQQMTLNGDFKFFKPYFFSVTQQGKKDPFGESVLDANNDDLLWCMDIIVTCQGAQYTHLTYPKLKSRGWSGYWLDASSALRMNDESEIVLDPVNRSLLQTAIENGKKVFVGGNCTVSLLLMALYGLIKEGLIEWVSSHTYQAASGAGAQHMEELFAQMRYFALNIDKYQDSIELERFISQCMENKDYPHQHFKASLAANILPWIDEKMTNGQTREEWKANTEAKKILQTTNDFLIDGYCVRVGSFRSHAQALTIKLKKTVDLNTVEELLKNSHPWIKFIANNQTDTLQYLTPAAVANTLDIAIGRVRPMILGHDFLSVFTVADQLLWGASEPIRRFLLILLQVL